MLAIGVDRTGVPSPPTREGRGEGTQICERCLTNSTVLVLARIFHELPDGEKKPGFLRQFSPTLSEIVALSEKSTIRSRASATRHLFMNNPG